MLNKKKQLLSLVSLFSILINLVSLVKQSLKPNTSQLNSKLTLQSCNH